MIFSGVWVIAQGSRYLQIDLNGGSSVPVGAYANQTMFAGQGQHFSGGFDYFFNKIGFGFTGGYFNNESENLFRDFVNLKYYEYPAQNNQQSWNTKYVLFGPTFKMSFGKFEVDVFAKGGLSQINVPSLLFGKRFFNQSYEVFYFSGTSKDWQYAWAGGLRMIFKVNDWIGIQAKTDYFATQFLSKVKYGYTFRDATDGNRNGVIDDAEYFESQKVSKNNNAEVSAVNLNLGIIVQLGRNYQKNIKMIPQMSDITQPDIDNTTDIPAISKVNEDTEVRESMDDLDSISIVNAKEEEEIKKAEADRVILEPVQIPETTYDAPESTYDEEAAEFLYKAGESYFAVNDFENALPCFNKLKADPKYPRAKYMFALSLCAMGNCDEGKREYKDFAKTYKETDSRTLEIIFASQFEKCALGNKSRSKVVPPQKSTTTNDEVVKKEIKSVLPKEFRIQFIAIRQPNATFPGVAKVGTVVTEYFPNKSVYRYTLSGYESVNIAANDLAKVRNMGFRDAFIAVYENGQRVNTIYHKR
jgi:tetratricopeptide (TPR) repeat protein